MNRSSQRRYKPNEYYRTMIERARDWLADKCARDDVENPSLEQRMINVKHSGKPA
ncbi:hypothetical protein [Rhizobium phage RHph_X2_24]|nr:hypothetical protein [Rhizobium phage RHph_X2_24]